MLLAVLALMVCPAKPASGQEEGRGEQAAAEVSLDLGSHYVWRGLRLSQGLVSQASLDGEYRGFGAGVWSNYDPREYPIESGSRKRITETDVTLWYGGTWGPGRATGGLIYYAQRGAPDTAELFAAYELDAPLAPSATLFVDVDEGDGAFLLLAAGHSVPLSGAAALDLGAEAGLNLGNAAMGTGEDGEAFTGPYHAEIWAGGSVAIGRGVALAPRLAVSFPLSSRAGDAVAWASYDGETRTCVYASLGLTAAF